MAYSQEDIHELKETFDIFDTKGDRKISASQLGDVLRAMGENPTEQEIKKCGYSQNPDARISFETFLPILQNIRKNRQSPHVEDCIEGFRVFDKEGSGLISISDFRHVMTCLGERMSEDEVNELLAGNEDSHGYIHYEDFCRKILSG